MSRLSQAPTRHAEGVNIKAFKMPDMNLDNFRTLAQSPLEALNIEEKHLRISMVPEFYAMKNYIAIALRITQKTF